MQTLGALEPSFAVQGEKFGFDNVALQRYARNYGVQIIDVRIKHADYPEGSPLQSALDRMKNTREQQAQTIRSGQRIVHEGHLIIGGDVNAGAAIRIRLV